MKTDWVLAAIFAAVLAICVAEEKGENESGESKLKVETLVAPPEDCDRKSEVGNILRMHYKGTLASDGTQFDSRFVLILYLILMGKEFIDHLLP